MRLLRSGCNRLKWGILMPSLTSVEVVYYPLVVIQTMFLPNVFISCLALVLDILTIDASPPHIIFFLADDLGWNDVGWKNREIKTPNLDRLARAGVILNSSYTQPVCTPSRTAILTGQYPFRTGLQSGIMPQDRPMYLPDKFRLLPEELKKLGYKTHMVGKWHLGYCNSKYTPTYRGFDSFLGFYGGAEDHYTHIRGQQSHIGLDFWFNSSVLATENGNYSTFVFARRAIDIIRTHNQESPLFLFVSFQAVHVPLQAPKRFKDMYSRIRYRSRRLYSAMVSAMDEAIGDITRSLKVEGLLKNSLVIFTSDNGGAPYAGGNNWPLRGGKTTLWEGGMRVPTLVYSKTLLKRRIQWHNGLFHAVDWYPTLLHIAGGKSSKTMDGVNQWMMIRKGTPSKRRQIVHNIDDIRQNAALRIGHMKLIHGNPGRYNNWYPVPTLWTDRCLYKADKLRLPEYQLFNITADPTESYDIAYKSPDILAKMIKILNRYKRKMVPSYLGTSTRKSNPKYYGGVWATGWC
ncbi:arylsulfatase J-like [Haliotis cracherodii]|uniref:arylsulfatase J-like n=1 Tax=Haliotis cracherodii TaxID=6455 RepID=UPI0039ECA46E